MALTTFPTLGRVGHLLELDAFAFGPFSGLIIRQLESKQAPAAGAGILHAPGEEGYRHSYHLIQSLMMYPGAARIFNQIAFGQTLLLSPISFLQVS